MTARHRHAHSRNSYVVRRIMAGAAARPRIYFWPLAPRVGAVRINHKIYNSRPRGKGKKKKQEGISTARNRTARNWRNVPERGQPGSTGRRGEGRREPRVLFKIRSSRSWSRGVDVYPASPCPLPSKKKKRRRIPARSHEGPEDSAEYSRRRNEPLSCFNF